MSRRLVAACVFAAALFLVAVPAREFGIGLGYLDPIDPVEAQDEAVYSHIALRMARTGEWGTPVFLGRYFLYKPPMLDWLSGASARVFGVSSWSLRLPSLLAGAATCLLAFLWVRKRAGTGNGLVSASLLLTSSLFVNLSFRNMTDALVCLAATSSMFLLSRDPAMVRLSSRVGFGVATSVATLTKSTAGLIPFLALGAYWIVARGGQRPRLKAMLASIGVACSAALPWFLYQYSIHPKWFWAEFFQVELLAWGLGAPPQTSSESSLMFYLVRLVRSSPALCAGTLIACLHLARRLWGRGRDSAGREVRAGVATAWVAVTVAAILAFQYQNATYLLLLLPGLAIVAGTQLPDRIGRAPITVVLPVIWMVPLFLPPARTPQSTVAARRLIEQRCSQGRDNELIVVTTVEQFYAALLHSDKVRYAFAGQAQPAAGFALDFREMGIAVAVNEFLALDQHRARFLRAMRSWGLDDDTAMATVITYSNVAELERLIRESPARDFLIPAALGSSLGSIPHRVRGGTDGALMLEGDARAGRKQPCRL